MSLEPYSATMSIASSHSTSRRDVSRAKPLGDLELPVVIHVLIAKHQNVMLVEGPKDLNDVFPADVVTEFNTADLCAERSVEYMNIALGIDCHSLINACP